MGAESAPAGRHRKAGDIALALQTAEGRRSFHRWIHRLLPALEKNCIQHGRLQPGFAHRPGRRARFIKLELPKFTLVGATTRAGLITPLCAPLCIVFIWTFTRTKIWSDLQTLGGDSGVEIDEDGAREIARRSRVRRDSEPLLRRVVITQGRLRRPHHQETLPTMRSTAWKLTPSASTK